MTTKRITRVALAAVLATLAATPAAMTGTTDSNAAATLALRIGGSEAAGGFKEVGGIAMRFGLATFGGGMSREN